jgi:hypothetical protein
MKMMQIGRPGLDRRGLYRSWSAASRGELRADIPPATMFATFVGPLYVRLLITDERIDDEFIENVIEAGLDGVRVTPHEASADGRG